MRICDTISRSKRTAIEIEIERSYGIDRGGGELLTCFGADNPLTPLIDIIQVKKASSGLNSIDDINLNPAYELALTTYVQGSGTATTEPAWLKLVRIAGFKQEITSTYIRYRPVFDKGESATIRVFLDGPKHVLTGARATFSLSGQTNGPVAVSNTIRGLYNKATLNEDTALSLAAFKAPPLLKNALFSLQSEKYGTITPVFKDFTFSQGTEFYLQKVSNSDNNIKSVQLRNGTYPIFECTVEVPRTFDYIEAGRLKEMFSLDLTIGQKTGNKVSLNTPGGKTAQLRATTTYGDSKGFRVARLQFALKGSDYINFIHS